jgi:repressor of nif and glnA expression
MQLADIQRCTISKEKLIESVYMLIKNDYGGRATTKHIEKEMDDMGKRKMRYAIRRLTQEGKIKRVRGFGPKGIQYYYEIL